MHPSLRHLLVASLLGAIPAVVSAQAADTTIKEDTPGLLARARVRPDSARAVARRAVPGGVIRSAELENEDRKLIYSFDMAVAGRSGIEEIHVDAMTGRVIKREHEDAEDEAAEAREEHAAPHADTTLRQESRGLLAQARVTPDSAKAIARRAVPGATIQSFELENEDHKLIYSLDMKVSGKEGIEEVNIDARTGAIVAQEHEDARAERREAESEHRAAPARSRRPATTTPPTRTP